MGILEDDAKKRLQINNTLAAQKKAAQAAADTEAAQAKVDAASSKTNTGLGGFLSSLINGVGEKIGDVGEAVGTTLATPIAAFNDAINKHNTTATNEDASNKRNEIAKKYGFSSYSDALSDANADKLSDDFWNDIKSANNETKERVAQNEAIAGQSAVDKYVQNKDANEFAGQALSTMGTIADVLPGGGLAGNVISGTLEGMGDSFKNAKGKAAGDVDLADAFSRAAVGGISSAVASGVGNKLATANGAQSLLGKALQSNIGKGALTGAAAGATSGALTQAGASVAAGEDLGSVLGNAWSGALSGAGSGAAGGAVMSGVQGLTNKGIQAVSNKLQGIDSNKTADIADTTEPTTKAMQDIAADTDATTTKTLSDGERLKLQSEADDIKRQRNAGIVQNEIGFNDVNSRRDSFAKSINDAAGDLYDDGLTTRADWQTAHNALYDSESGTMQKARRQILKDSGTINATADGSNGLSESNLTKMAKRAKLSGDELKKAVANASNAISQASEDSGYTGLSDVTNGKMDLLDYDDLMKSMEKTSKDARAAKGSSTEATPLSEFYNEIAKTMSDNIDNATADAFSKFKSSGAANNLTAAIDELYPQYTQKVKSKVADANSLSEMRSLGQDTTIVTKALENSIANTTSAPSTGQAIIGQIANDVPTSAVGAAKSVIKGAAKSKNSGKAIDVDALTKQYAEKIAQLNGDTTTSAAASTKTSKLGNIKSKAANNAFVKELSNLASDAKSLASKPISAAGKVLSAANASTARTGNAVLDQIINGANNLYSREVNRQIAQDQYEGYGNQLDLQNAQAELETAKTAQSTADSELETIQKQSSTLGSSTALEQSQNQLLNIQNAMQSALAAGDISSYSTLADLYNTAYSIYETQAEMYGASSSSATTDTELSDDQAKAKSAMEALNNLQNSEITTGTYLSQTPLSGLVNLFGGDTYTANADALAAELTYLLSGASASEKEKQVIRDSYIPSATDSEAVKAQKIANAKSVINNYLSGSGYSVQ